jgi:hypothetical protein
VVIDEAYVEYADAGSGPDSLALYRRYPNVCILRTFSKAYGLAGLRVGYAVAAPAIAEGLRRTALPFAVSALAQKAAVASLDAGEEMEARVAVVRQERSRMAAQLEAQGWKLQPSQGNFLWIRADDDLGRGWWPRSMPPASWSGRTRATACGSPLPTPPPTTACSGSSKPTRPEPPSFHLYPFHLQPRGIPMEQQTKTSARALGAALKPRQLTMMGLGSAIGAGLFIGSGAGIQAAGPAVLISYLVAGTLIILVMWALGEMAAANPDSGAFSVYTAKAYGPVAGATVGWLWWLQLVVVIAAEALGAAGLLATIFPALPVWLMAFVFIVVLTAVNLTSVKNFGEFEFWFALLKVAAIVGFLLVGVALLFGWLPGVQSPGLANFTGEGFAPSGFAGIATALFVVAFAFGGTEIVSVAAAETAGACPQREEGRPDGAVAHPGLLHRRDLRDRGCGSRGFGGAEEPVRRGAGRRRHARRSHRHHPGGRRGTALRPQRQPLRRLPDGVLPRRAR